MLGNGKASGPRALTFEERQQWLAQLEADEKAVRWDLPDLSRFLMATGVRIGEALALYWEDVDLANSFVDIKYTVVRVKGQGLKRKPTKTAAGERVLPLPSWTVDMLQTRHDAAKEAGRPPASPVFANQDGNLRDPSNTLRALREARGTEGFEWVTSHVFRKTAATVLDDAGLSARKIADQLGHAKPSMTQDVYLGRKVVSWDAAEVLESILDKKST
ncbi:site-specific integrase [Prauserella oleivorans]|uniref:Site-specific integrase n=1 Tax=Prauserella oleivorans TaxID=1478153 RepID=A0ABW5WAK1_9PSEU